jgi:hypothetical protein
MAKLLIYAGNTHVPHCGCSALTPYPDDEKILLCSYPYFAIEIHSYFIAK